MTFWKPEHLSACLAFCSARWEVSLFLVFLHLGLGEVRCHTESARWCGKPWHGLSKTVSLPFPHHLPHAWGEENEYENVCTCVHMCLTTKTGPERAECNLVHLKPVVSHLVDFLGTCLSDSRNSSFLILLARSCFLKCWINW